MHQYYHVFFECHYNFIWFLTQCLYLAWLNKFFLFRSPTSFFCLDFIQQNMKKDIYDNSTEDNYSDRSADLLVLIIYTF